MILNIYDLQIFKWYSLFNDLPRKYLDQLQKQSSKVRRKLLFVNEINYKNKLINNWQKNQFRNTLSKLLIDENIGIMGLNCVSIILIY